MHLEKENIGTFYPEGAKRAYDVKYLLGLVRVEIDPVASEKEIIQLLKEILSKQYNKDTEENISRFLRYLKLTPTVMGFGVDIGAILRDLYTHFKPEGTQ